MFAPQRQGHQRKLLKPEKVLFFCKNLYSNGEVITRPPVTSKTFLFEMMKTVRLSSIKISKEMKDTLPRAEKIAEKYVYCSNQLRINKEYNDIRKLFKTDIIMDKHYVLQDGYINYLLAKMFGMKKIDVVIR